MANKTIIGIVVLLLVVFSGCAQKQTKPSVPQGAAGPAEEIGASESPETPSTSEVKEFTMTARRFSFDPETITVSEGDTVRLVITSLDVEHGIAINEFGVDERIPAGSTAIVEFIADKPGTFEFRCAVYCGSGHGGMTGTLVVE